MGKVLAVIQKNTREAIHVSLDEYNGHQLFNARVFFKVDDGTVRPGKAGLAFRVEKLSAFAEAVRSALAEAERRGLL